MIPGPKVHFIGIGGYGMSGLAMALLERGYHVSGSDVEEKPILDELRAKGAIIFLGHDVDHVRGTNLVVYSTAVAADNVERVAAQALQIPLWHRSELLAAFLSAGSGIAVAGSHGKTTTTTMIGLILLDAGADPTVIVGGEVPAFAGTARAGRSPVIVAEADESDRSFLRYHPSIAVVTNVEPDHLEHYNGQVKLLQEAFLQYINQTQPDGLAVLCLDDAFLQEAIGQHQIHVPFMTYGSCTSASWRVCNAKVGATGTDFLLCHEDERFSLHLNLYGSQYAIDAAAAFAVCRHLDIPPAKIAHTLSTMQNAHRRFEVLYRDDQFIVVDDYAHHPTEIAATLQTARAIASGRVIACFQPQRFTRTQYLFDQFATAFQDADEVFVLPIYAPVGDRPTHGIDSEHLVEAIGHKSNTSAHYVPDMESLFAVLVQHLAPGDVVVTMGATGIWRLAEKLRDYAAEHHGSFMVR